MRASGFIAADQFAAVWTEYGAFGGFIHDDEQSNNSSLICQIN
jgi:hypothetical protein